MEKNIENKYILARLQVKEQNNREKKNSMVDIYYELFDTHTLYIKKIDMNKKFNVSLICKV